MWISILLHCQCFDINQLFCGQHQMCGGKCWRTENFRRLFLKSEDPSQTVQIKCLNWGLKMISDERKMAWLSQQPLELNRSLHLDCICILKVPFWVSLVSTRIWGDGQPIDCQAICLTDSLQGFHSSTFQKLKFPNKLLRWQKELQ